MYSMSLMKFIDNKSIQVISDLETKLVINGELIYTYYSTALGVIIRNLTTKTVTRLGKNSGIIKLKTTEDINGNILIGARKSQGLIIYQYDVLEANYLEVNVDLASSIKDYFLITYAAETLIVYFKDFDNRVYYKKSSNSYTTEYLLDDRVFEKQNLKTVFYTEGMNYPNLYFEVKDNTLLRGYDSYKNVWVGKVFVETSENILFLKER